VVFSNIPKTKATNHPHKRRLARQKAAGVVIPVQHIKYNGKGISKDKPKAKKTFFNTKSSNLVMSVLFTNAFGYKRLEKTQKLAEIDLRKYAKAIPA